MSVLEGGVSFGFKYSENHCDVRHRLFARFDSFRRLDRQINVRQGRSRLRQRKYGYDQHVSRAWKKGRNHRFGDGHVQGNFNGSASDDVWHACQRFADRSFGNHRPRLSDLCRIQRRKSRCDERRRAFGL